MLAGGFRPGDLGSLWGGTQGGLLWVPCSVTSGSWTCQLLASPVPSPQEEGALHVLWGVPGPPVWGLQVCGEPCHHRREGVRKQGSWRLSE